MLRFPDPTFKVKLGEWLGEVHSAVSSISFGGVFSQTLGTKPMPIGFFAICQATEASNCVLQS